MDINYKRMPSAESGRLADRISVMEAYDVLSCDYARLRSKSFPELERILTAGSYAISCDYGSGPGTNLPILDEISKELVCLDLSLRMLELAGTKAKSQNIRHKIHLVAADIASLPFREGAFDLSVCMAALHHLSSLDHAKAISEIIRSSKNLGKITASIWAPVAIMRSRVSRKRGDMIWVTWRKREETIERLYYRCELGQWQYLLDSCGLIWRDIFVSGANFFVSGLKI